MDDTQTGETSKAQHRLQPLVNSLTLLLGKAIALFLGFFTLASLGLVVSSAFAIHEILGVVSLILVILAYLIVGYITFLVRTSQITIIQKERKVTPDNFTPLYLLLVLAGFVQTVFWVIDPENSIHEPRAVLIIAVSGALAYFRSKYRE